MTAPTVETVITDVIHAALNMPIRAAGHLGHLRATLSDDRRTLTVQLVGYSPFTVEGDRIERVELFVGVAAPTTVVAPGAQASTPRDAQQLGEETQPDPVIGTHGATREFAPAVGVPTADGPAA